MQSLSKSNKVFHYLIIFAFTLHLISFHKSQDTKAAGYENHIQQIKVENECQNKAAGSDQCSHMHCFVNDCFFDKSDIQKSAPVINGLVNQIEPIYVLNVTNDKIITYKTNQYTSIKSIPKTIVLII